MMAKLVIFFEREESNIKFFSYQRRRRTERVADEEEVLTFDCLTFDSLGFLEERFVERFVARLG